MSKKKKKRKNSIGLISKSSDKEFLLYDTEQGSDEIAQRSYLLCRNFNTHSMHAFQYLKRHIQ